MRPPRCRRRGAGQLPVLFASDPRVARRVVEFFTAQIRSLPARKAYARTAGGFSDWYDAHGVAHLRDVEPVHVADYVEDLQLRMAAPSLKLRLARIRMLVDWLVVRQIIPTNPASAVFGPKRSVKKGTTPVLTAKEARELLDSILTDTLTGLRDRALIALIGYAFARVGACASPANPRDGTSRRPRPAASRKIQAPRLRSGARITSRPSPMAARRLDRWTVRAPISRPDHQWEPVTGAAWSCRGDGT